MISPVIYGNEKPLPDSDYTDDVGRIQTISWKRFTETSNFDIPVKEPANDMETKLPTNYQDGIQLDLFLQKLKILFEYPRRVLKHNADNRYMIRPSIGRKLLE